MAPPLFDGPKLSPCPNCGIHIKRSDSTCLHCGAQLGARGSAFAPMVLPVALGMLLAGCADDSTAVDSSGTAADTAADSTGSTPTTGMDQGGTSSDSNDEFADSVGEAAYGVPTSGDFSSTGPGTDSGTTSGSDTGTGSDSGSGSGSGSGSSGTDDGSSTGDGSTSGSSDGAEVGEPEYGVPTTGIEPLYGVGISDDGLSAGG